MDTPEILFKALADPARVRIVTALARPEALCCSAADQVCACDLERLLGLAQPTISHHMKILVQAGLVEGRKSGRWVYYRLNRNRFSALAEHLTALAGDDAPPPARHPPHTEEARHGQL
jgi:ArsR family transcriptional regulator